MRTAIVSYDLENVRLGDNFRVKSKLASFGNTYTTFQVLSTASSFPEWVNLRFPETTLCVSVINPLITTEKIADEVAIAIQSVDAIPGKIYVAFITDAFLWNAE